MNSIIKLLELVAKCDQTMEKYEPYKLTDISACGEYYRAKGTRLGLAQELKRQGHNIAEYTPVIEVVKEAHKDHIAALKSTIEDFHIRTCCQCGKTMWAGWYNEDTGEYYCGEEHLLLDFTDEEKEEAEESNTLWATMWEEEEEEYESLIAELEELEAK